MDGSSYYQEQSRARGLQCPADVSRLATFEKQVFDRLILPYLERTESTKIYEAAVGPGILQSWINESGFVDVEGSDFSSKEIAIARTFNANVVCDDSIHDLVSRFPENHFDAIIALDFYEHLPREEFRKFISAAFSRLKNDGILIMRGPNGDSPLVGCNLYNDMTHVWAYTTVCLRALLHLAGFSRIWFADDARAALHRGRVWKLPLMVVAQQILTLVFWAATRHKVEFWGPSLYVYARK